MIKNIDGPIGLQTEINYKGDGFLIRNPNPLVSTII
jgi:hypothetical protein